MTPGGLSPTGGERHPGDALGEWAQSMRSKGDGVKVIDLLQAIDDWMVVCHQQESEIERLTACDYCAGEGYTIEPVPQCGDYEHEHSEDCVVPDQVRCRCQMPLRRPVTDDEEPF